MELTYIRVSPALDSVSSTHLTYQHMTNNSNPSKSSTIQKRRVEFHQAHVVESVDLMTKPKNQQQVNNSNSSNENNLEVHQQPKPSPV